MIELKRHQAIPHLWEVEERFSLTKTPQVKIPEMAIQKLIVEYLEHLGMYPIELKLGGTLHTVNGKTFAKKNPNAGLPDIEVIHKGFHFWIEVKTPTGKLSSVQKEKIAKLQRHGSHVFVARSLEDVIKEVARIGII